MHCVLFIKEFPLCWRSIWVNIYILYYSCLIIIISNKIPNKIKIEMNATVATHMVALEQRVVNLDFVMWHVQVNQLRCVVVAVPTQFI